MNSINNMIHKSRLNKSNKSNKSDRVGKLDRANRVRQPLQLQQKTNNIDGTNCANDANSVNSAESIKNTLSTNVGSLRFVINGRYFSENVLEVVTKSGENYTIQPKTILTVNRFENTIPVLRWMAFDLKKFIEIDAVESISSKLKNIV